MPLTLDNVTWPLRTERLTIRRATPQDADAVWRYRRDPSVAEWMYRLEQDQRSHHERFQLADQLPQTLVALHGDTIIGDLLVRQHDAWAQDEVAAKAAGATAEIGWVFDPAVQGRGLATEAAGALLRLCLESLGLHRVTAICFSDNTASWRVMEKVGMRRETHAVAESLHRSGRWLDSYTYALLRSEWEEQGSDSSPLHPPQ